MKRIFTLLLMFCALSIVSKAQIRVGVKGGPNISYLIFDPDTGIDLSPRFGFHLGGFAYYGFSDNIGIQGELTYSTQGGRSEIENDFSGIVVENTFKFNYLNLPVFFKYTTNSGVTFEAGPSFNFLLNAELTTEERAGGQNLSTDQDVTDELNGVDVNFLLGAGYELPSGISFNGRFATSLSNIFDEDITDPSILELFNGLFQVSVGFPLYGN